MKKKLFAMLAAGTMLCGMLTAPVSAAETSYQMGDVNMDGAVDVADAQMTLQEYVMLVLCRRAEGSLTPEQRQVMYDALTCISGHLERLAAPRKSQNGETDL